MGTGMGGNGNKGDEKNGNRNSVLEWEWVGMGMGMIRWEWEGNGNKKVIPAHLYPIPILYLCQFYCSSRLFKFFRALSPSSRSLCPQTLMVNMIRT